MKIRKSQLTEIIKEVVSELSIKERKILKNKLLKEDATNDSISKALVDVSKDLSKIGSSARDNSKRQDYTELMAGKASVIDQLQIIIKTLQAIK